MTPSGDYHDYVIKDGQFIGKFEEMYRDCDDPWHESTEDYEDSACSLATKRLIHAMGRPLVVSLGSGKGRHLQWLECFGFGVETSQTAINHAPCATFHADAIEFLRSPYAIDDVYLFREVVWYLLQDWKEICTLLATKHGALVIVELSFYDEQHYGRDYFDGPDDFIRKWPFTIEKIVREHTTKHQREGRLMIAGKVV